jgi:hypothetical protein
MLSWLVALVPFLHVLIYSGRFLNKLGKTHDVIIGFLKQVIFLLLRSVFTGNGGRLALTEYSHKC